MMSVRVDARTEFTASPPARLVHDQYRADSGDVPQYGVTADGQRFLGLERVGGGSELHVPAQLARTREQAGLSAGSAPYAASV